MLSNSVVFRLLYLIGENLFEVVYYVCKAVVKDVVIQHNNPKIEWVK